MIKAEEILGVKYWLLPRPPRWKFEYLKVQWHRPALWIALDFKAPFVSVSFLWWIVGFGRFLDLPNDCTAALGGKDAICIGEAEEVSLGKTPRDRRALD